MPAGVAAAAAAARAFSAAAALTGAGDKGKDDAEAAEQSAGNKNPCHTSPRLAGRARSASFDVDIFSLAATGGDVETKGGGAGLFEEHAALMDNWDDAEGYYKLRVGEVMNKRYRVRGSSGRGVFSTVHVCDDLMAAGSPRAKAAKAKAKAGGGAASAGGDSGGALQVAIKIVRKNEIMRKAAEKEIAILQELRAEDPDDRRHCVRLLGHFTHRDHVCMVFELLAMNLRDVLKKFGKRVGISLSAVRTYAHQLFLALYLMEKTGIIHADLKPDNILVNHRMTLLKLADFGSAFRITDPDNDPTPYLVSRFYRAPEIVLALPYDPAIDVWAAACSLFEMYTGSVLFPGSSNNEMLKLQQEVCGAFSNKMIRRHQIAYDALAMEPHFDSSWRFLQHEADRVTGKAVVKLVTFTAKPKRKLEDMLMASKATGVDRRMVLQLTDLLASSLALDPQHRLKPADALQHPFITGKLPVREARKGGSAHGRKR